MAAVSEKPFNLAIVGGGISGLTMSISLTKHGIPHTLYESAAGFGEIGAGVGFMPTFVRTMGYIDPAMRNGFLRCAEWTDREYQVFFDFRVGDLRKADADGIVTVRNGKAIKIEETLFEWLSRPGPQGGVHRAHFLDELVKLIPSDIPQFRKRLVNITEATDGAGDAILHFADGTTAQHSAVIGCDGIKARTRELVLGTEEAKPVFSGKYAYRGLIPMSKAAEFMGPEMRQRSQMFVGYHGHVLTFPIAKGSILNVVAFNSRKTWDNDQWVVQTSREEMLADYVGWSPTVQSIMAAVEKPDIWALFNHTPARTYYQSRPRICLVGDAAHASTPHNGAGAGFGVEDCFILGELLAATSSVHELDRAFEVYDKIRRPRSLALVEKSREGAILYEFEGPEGDDLQAIEDNMSKRMSWIWDHDIIKDLEQALRDLKSHS